MIKWPFLFGNVFLLHNIETAKASKAEKASLLRKLRCWWQICYSWSSIYQGFNLHQHIESHLRDNVGFPYSHPYIGLPWLAAITQKRLKKSSTHRFSFFHIEYKSKLCLKRKIQAGITFKRTHDPKNNWFKQIWYVAKAMENTILKENWFAL